MSDAAPVANKNRWGWILWWQIDPADLERQVAEYDSLGFFHSMRGLSVICLSLSVALTVTLIGFGALGLGASAFIDAAIMAILALFIYLGHRWASLAAMIIWTTEKIEVAQSGDLAYSTGTDRISMTGPDGKTISSDNRAVVIWKKQADGSWRCIVDVMTPAEARGAKLTGEFAVREALVK